MSSQPADPFLVAAEQFRTVGVLSDPVEWIERRLGEQLWSKQRQIAAAVREHRYVAVPSCHDAGKSFLASRIAAWWVDAHPPTQAFVVSTAPTFPQVRAILWREIGRAHRRGRLRGRVNQTEWHLDGEIVGYGRKPADYDQAAFQGIHARYVLVIIDEACGVPRSLFDAVDTIVTNEYARVLAIGNPDDPASHFAEICKPGSGWHVIPIDGYDTPNFTDEDVDEQLSELLLSRTWVQERKDRWGEESPLFVAKVRGQFPEDSSDATVPLSFVNRCRTGPALEAEEPVELGVDVGAGGDETVIRERRGMTAGRVWRSRHDDPMRCVGEIVAAIGETGATSVKVDVIGVGWGVAGRLEEVGTEGGHGARVSRVNVAERARDRSKFVNLRAEMWWELGRELSRTEAWDLAAVDDDCVAELISPRYTLDSSGRIKVESKDEIRKRLGRSTNDADALLLAFLSAPVGSIRGTGARAARMRVPTGVQA